MRYDLTDLRLFVAVADAGNISRGAAACFLSPSSASLRLKSLEDALQVQLLQRLPRGVALTRPGQVLLEHSRRCMAELEQMHANIAPYAAGVKGQVTIFANSTALASYLPSDLTAFLQTRPTVRVNLEGRLSHDIVAAVADGRADIGVVTWDGEHPDLEFRAYHEDELVVLVPEPSKLLAGKAARFTDCLEYPFVSLQSGSAIHTFLQNKAAVLGRHVDVRIQVTSFTEVIAMVAAGVGIAILPRSVASHSTETRVRTLKLEEEWAHRVLRVCWHTGHAVSEHVAALVERLCGQASA
ncbi:LysR family transcriptional regulator [Alcaligenaceae bacterium]|nr:LysR family transcriptional regulator [Alcaligenaceae bacterium]